MPDGQPKGILESADQSGLERVLGKTLAQSPVHRASQAGFLIAVCVVGGGGAGGTSPSCVSCLFLSLWYSPGTPNHADPRG